MKKNNTPGGSQGFYNWGANQNQPQQMQMPLDFMQPSQPSQDNSQTTLQSEINKYSNMSEERLMQEMFALVNEGKKNGTLNNQQLEEFFNSASCMLSSEQVSKLRGIIDLAKE